MSASFPNIETASKELLDAWNHYHQTLEQSRLDLEESSRFQRTPQHRAKAYHCLMEVQAMAYNFIVAPRMLHPRIHFNTGWQTNMYTLGQNGQDFLYGVIFVDGKQQYRLSGRMGDISVFLLQTHNGVFGEDGVNITGNYDWADFEIDSDGRFDITMSAEKVEGNWIKIDPDSGYQFMLIRRAMPDWCGDRGELYLDRISELPNDAYDYDEFDESAMATRIMRAADFVRYMIHDFTLNLYTMYAKNCGDVKNKLVLIPGTESSQVGSPSSNYAMAVFELEDDEALLIEMDQCPSGTYWSFQAGDVWSRSLDFSNRQSSLNNTEVTTNSDGSILIVVSRQDPGVHNWLDTCGRCEGTIVFRNYRSLTRPVPNSRKVNVAELPDIIKSQVKVTPEERKAAMKKRRAAQLNWYGE